MPRTRTNGTSCSQGLPPSGDAPSANTDAVGNISYCLAGARFAARRSRASAAPANASPAATSRGVHPHLVRDVPRDGVDPPSDILGRFGPDRHASHAGVCHRLLLGRLACQALVKRCPETFKSPKRYTLSNPPQGVKVKV